DQRRSPDDEERRVEKSDEKAPHRVDVGSAEQREVAQRGGVAQMDRWNELEDGPDDGERKQTQPRDAKRARGARATSSAAERGRGHGRCGEGLSRHPPKGTACDKASLNAV